VIFLGACFVPTSTTELNVGKLLTIPWEET